MDISRKTITDEKILEKENFIDNKEFAVYYDLYNKIINSNPKNKGVPYDQVP